MSYLLRRLEFFAITLWAALTINFIHPVADIIASGIAPTDDLEEVLDGYLKTTRLSALSANEPPQRGAGERA